MLWVLLGVPSSIRVRFRARGTVRDRVRDNARVRDRIMARVRVLGLGPFPVLVWYYHRGP